MEWNHPSLPHSVPPCVRTAPFCIEPAPPPCIIYVTQGGVLAQADDSRLCLQSAAMGRWQGWDKHRYASRGGGGC